MTDYERIGEERLRALMKDFVGRISQDFVIGFFFAGKDLDRIAEKEFELASTHLGGPHAYTGRPIAQAHGPHRINSGHFRRRLAFLSTVLRDHGVDDDIIQRWMAHDERLLSQITDGTDCVA